MLPGILPKTWLELLSYFEVTKYSPSQEKHLCQESLVLCFLFLKPQRLVPPYDHFPPRLGQPSFSVHRSLYLASYNLLSLSLSVLLCDDNRLSVTSKHFTKFTLQRMHTSSWGAWVSSNSKWCIVHVLYILTYWPNNYHKSIHNLIHKEVVEKVLSCYKTDRCIALLPSFLNVC